MKKGYWSPDRICIKPTELTRRGTSIESPAFSKFVTRQERKTPLRLKGVGKRHNEFGVSVN
ncbi:MAG: hypothetical protein A3H45_01765 [Ignavibacteria bacterium RIFCSPLOWO2_02_FULL_55_14]|nr:MAG: hypothetical protein A3H45_01765 [Ignavibacteria bacterium RIFCSPLOWO2_02_FULL_55_14]